MCWKHSFDLLLFSSIYMHQHFHIPHNLLHKIGRREATFRTSLYADNAAIFVAPIKQDVQNPTTILDSFDEVTGLSINFQKTFVAPIRCGNLNLNDILQNLPDI